MVVVMQLFLSCVGVLRVFWKLHTYISFSLCLVSCQLCTVPGPQRSERQRQEKRGVLKRRRPSALWCLEWDPGTEQGL